MERRKVGKKKKKSTCAAKLGCIEIYIRASLKKCHPNRWVPQNAYSLKLKSIRRGILYEIFSIYEPSLVLLLLFYFQIDSALPFSIWTHISKFDSELQGCSHELFQPVWLSRKRPERAISPKPRASPWAMVTSINSP